MIIKSQKNYVDNVLSIICESTKSHPYNIVISILRYLVKNVIFDFVSKCSHL